MNALCEFRIGQLIDSTTDLREKTVGLGGWSPEILSNENRNDERVHGNNTGHDDGD